METDAQKQSREKRLRGVILRTLDSAQEYSPNGGLRGDTLVDMIEKSLPCEQHFLDDGHAVKLIRELVNMGMLEEKPLDFGRHERLSPRHMRLRITEKGILQANGELPVNPLIQDERMPLDEREW